MEALADTLMAMSTWLTPTSQFTRILWAFSACSAKAWGGYGHFQHALQRPGAGLSELPGQIGVLRCPSEVHALAPFPPPPAKPQTALHGPLIEALRP